MKFVQITPALLEYYNYLKSNIATKSETYTQLLFTIFGGERKFGTKDTSIYLTNRFHFAMCLFVQL